MVSFAHCTITVYILAMYCLVSSFQLDTKSEQILDDLRKKIGNQIDEERLVAIDVANAEVSRLIQQRGFHRNVTTTVRLNMMDNISSNFTCHILMIDHIPSGAFVDPDQLKNRIDFGGPQVVILDEIDIEKPEYMSEEISIISFQTFKSLSSSTSCQINLTISFPLHLRYHRPSNESTINFANVTIHPPDTFIRCIPDDTDSSNINQDCKLILAPCSYTKTKLCHWQSIRKNEGMSIILQVPVGQQNDFVVVFLGTVLCVIASVLYILYVLFKSSKDVVT
ncbi:phosphatidylinositol-glycan biosynthesis class X protein-like [Antedon mediterranea]|uniref:phosphatidylinositol-glycan biosynthesis class X protein-like n=1 Tax=Antedon mediterranea TaxID=105859 RepID=UPI003AF5EBFC